MNGIISPLFFVPSLVRAIGYLKSTKEPNILVGGKLKDNQVIGLQWMVSLYNNRLYGIRQTRW
jgi:hypothetical protein